MNKKTVYIKKAILSGLLTLTLLILSCKEDEPTKPQNQKPQIQSISANPSTIKVNEETTLTCIATDPDGDNLTISWTAPSGSFPYGNIGASVKWKAPDNVGIFVISATVSDGEDTDKEDVNVIVEITGTAPEVPTLSSPLNGATNIELPPSLIWNASTGATSYTLQVSTSSNFTTFVYNQSGLTSTSQQVTGLNISTYYYWRVSAENSYGTSDWSTIRNFRTAAGGTVLVEPILYLPVDGAISIGSSVNLRWYASDGATSYTLQLSTDINFTTLIYNQSGLTFTNQSISGLSSTTKYFWRVRATNNYGNSDWSFIWCFATAGVIQLNVPCPSIPTITYSGKTYNTVLIGTQCFLKENLDVGTMISGSQDQTDNGVIEKYCYDNDQNNCNIYGGLYQWSEAMKYSITPGVQGICPPGWHIPTKGEFRILRSTVNNDGNALKAIGQGTGNGAGTNTSGFSALLAGFRRYDNGYFTDLNHYGVFWGSNEYSSSGGLGTGLMVESDSGSAGNMIGDKANGFSVRCVKD